MKANPISKIKVNPNIPQLSPGDTVRVSFKVKEASRERVQTLLGLVVRVRTGAGGGNFTVRRVTYGVGVEHTFPFASPFLEKVEVVRHGKVRRAKLYYIRRLSAREARLKERREKMEEKAAVIGAVGDEGEVIEIAAEEGVVGEPAVEEVAVEKTEEAE
ncbi:MAG: 50S ribosomal protein L19 [Chloroflexi bacterium]|nr:50S ribosomal protein L19 [Chloroflexota bacterium]